MKNTTYNYNDIESLFNGLNIDDQIAIYNQYVDDMRLDNYIYYMSDIDDLFYDMKISDFLSKLAHDFCPNDDYIVDTIFGLSSTALPYDDYIVDIMDDVFYEWITENYHYFDYIDEIVAYFEK